MKLEPIHEYRVALLVAALRSDKYKQGTHRLRTGDHYCCLGVGCDISNVGQWEESSVKEMSSFGPERIVIYYVSRGYWERTTLPSAVQDWLFGTGNIGDPGLTFDDGSILNASIANDSWAMSFVQIARGFELTFLSGQMADEVLARGEPT
jgi:hypothetical protein